MSRQAFRKAVFARDGYHCVFCQAPAVDAHHLLERRLWDDGGYHVDNGISVCATCHLRCEQTVLSVEEGRAAAGIERVLVPNHLERDQPYDKWGNPILASGKRLVGELFADRSVQTALRQGNALRLFVPYMKYPRTYHLPWSHLTTNSDRVLSSGDLSRHFEGREVIVTEKLDGENTSMYCDHIHARSLDSRHHPAQSWVKQFWSQIAHEIPDGWRICGENLYAMHSIHYTGLATFFYGFSVWDWHDCLSWDDTLEWFALLGITPSPVLYEGPFERAVIEGLRVDETRSEGYVVRVRGGFAYKEFRHAVAKYVRPNHLRNRWARAGWERNA